MAAAFVDRNEPHQKFRQVMLDSGGRKGRNRVLAMPGATAADLGSAGNIRAAFDAASDAAR
jgi:hypothetical protein